MTKAIGKKSNQKAWWNDLPPQVGGDVNTVNIGSGAHDIQGVAAGRYNQQTITKILGAPTPGDKQAIEQKLVELNKALEKFSGQIDANTVKMAEFQIKLLGGELTKTSEKESPSATTITQVGDWLLDNVPQVAETVVGLFATPAVGRVVGKAGEVAINWVKQKLGKT